MVASAGSLKNLTKHKEVRKLEKELIMLNIISRISFLVLPCYKQFIPLSVDVNVISFSIQTPYVVDMQWVSLFWHLSLSHKPQWCILVLSCNYTLHTGKVGVLNTTRPECLPDDQFVVEWKICFLPSTFVSTYHLSQAKCWEKSVVLVNTLIQITFSKHVTV